MQPSTRARRTLTSLLVVGVAVGTVTFSGSGYAQAAPAAPPSAAPDAGTDAASATAKAAKDTPAEALGAHDAELLSKAEAKGEKRVTVIIAADKNTTAKVGADVKKLGGTVTRTVDQVGYVSAEIPTGNVVKAAKLAGVKALDLDETIRLPKPEAVDAGKGVQAHPAVVAPGADTKAINPFMPVNEIGGVVFKTKHPRWDGRGVTVGIMDSGVDLDHPALQKTTTGERKIVDWVTATNPVSNTEPDPSWRAMITQVSGPSFTAAGATWTAPAGTWRFSRFSEDITIADEALGDVNRDGDTTDKWGVLYDPTSHDIRVDVNQNRDFTDDAVMRPYNEKFDIGHFGVDNPATAIREQMPFVVEYREDVDISPDPNAPNLVDFVNIGIVEGLHGTHVAGITAANDLFGNKDFDGVAPGAKIVSARSCSWGGGCTADSLTAGMIDLVVNRHVDVINMSIGGLPALNDGNNARAYLYDILIEDYNVEMFISAGNSGPGLNTIGDPSVANKVVSVAASVSKETWQSNYGSTVTADNALFPFSSRGPREDGGFKPNIAAPGSAVSATPLWLDEQDLAEAGYTLPPGYAMENGTSMAAPMATGGAALLLSAGKATQKTVTSAALRRAIYSSADPMANTSVAGQGYGQMDVNGAWKLLQEPIETRNYTSAAPVCTPLSGFFTRPFPEVDANGDPIPNPNVGTGVYNRCSASAGGQTAGVKRSYTVTLTRTSGPDKPIRHELDFVGNDGSFDLPGKGWVDLPLNRSVEVTVDAEAPAGAHSAILMVDDPDTDIVDFEVLNTVVVAATPAAPAYGATLTGSVQRNNTRSLFVDVPAGAATLQVDIAGLTADSETRFIAINPYGVTVDDTSSRECYPHSVSKACKADERDYRNPIPGIWEIEVESRRTSGQLTNPFSLTAKVQGVVIEPAVLNVPSLPAGEASPVSWTVRNAYGPVVVTGQGGSLGSSAASRPSVAANASNTYTVTVPAGAERLDVAIGNTADLGADLDLYVLLNGKEVGRSADGDSEESVSLAKPAPGTYTVRVDGYLVPKGTTEFDYRDVIFSPTFGSVTADPAQVTLATAASATITGTVTANAAPPAGRSLFGQLNVVTTQGALVGTAAVNIGTVS